MADVNRGNRPLSPHLDIYRREINMMTSILNRITGVGMGLAAFLIVWWLLAASSGPEYFSFVDGLLTSWIGLLILAGSLWALWFHFLGGLRHLWMDFGYGYEIDMVNKSGWVMVIGSLVLTVLSLLVLV
ncbi:MAG: succinate dehydrogenase, cytochrome b556 subunit [Rhodobacteraceae bacterium]|nr:succinate dehydrogenase, cytochrome b556 subunit [Paracoccaceae bacterium]